MPNNKSGVIRKKRTYYAQVSNVALRDETLSLKAKGLLAIIESYLTLDGFVLYKDFLLSKSTDGECSFRGAWKELKDHGYLIQYKYKDEETKRFYYEYEVCDNPQGENHLMAQKPHVEFPHVEKLPYGKATSGKPPMYNKNIYNNTLYINIIHTNINYDPVFINSEDRKMVDNIVDIMNEVLCSENQYVSIGGENVRLDIIKSAFMKVEMFHIQYVINVIQSYDEKIKNMKGFIISTLYNSVLTLDAHYTNAIMQN